MRRSQTRVDPLAELQTAGAGPSRSPMGTDSLPATPEADTMQGYTHEYPYKRSSLGLHTPLTFSRSPRSPLEESRVINGHPFPTPTSRASSRTISGQFPPSFAGATGYDFLQSAKETLAERSTLTGLDLLNHAAFFSTRVICDPIVDVAGTCGSPVSEAGSRSSGGFSFDDFAAVAAVAERSPPRRHDSLPCIDEQPSYAADKGAPADDPSREAASILMMVAEDPNSTAPRRTERTSRPTVKAASSSLKESRSLGKKAKTAPTPSIKARAEPAVSKQRTAPVNLKRFVEGGVEGVDSVPDLPYGEMIEKVIKLNNGPLRLDGIVHGWKQEWPCYQRFSAEDHASLRNSIRHNLTTHKDVFMNEKPQTYPDLLIADKKKYGSANGGWWSIRPGRSIAGQKALKKEAQEAKMRRDQQK